MFKLKVGDKEFTIRFDYKALATTDTLTRVAGMGSNPQLSRIIEDTAEFLLAGLQRYHSDEFGFTDDAERKDALDKVYFLMDEMDENNVSIVDTFAKISKDLEECHFLSEMMGLVEQETQPKGKRATKKTEEPSEK